MRLVLTVAAFAAALSAASAPASAEPPDPYAEDHAVIAIAPSTGTGGFGIAESFETAEHIALTQCELDSGVECIVATGIHHGCVTYVVAADGAWAGGRGPTEDAAIADALSKLPGAATIPVYCSTT